MVHAASRRVVPLVALVAAGMLASLTGRGGAVEPPLVGLPASKSAPVDTAALLKLVHNRLFDFTMAWRYAWYVGHPITRHPPGPAAGFARFASEVGSRRVQPPWLELPTTLCGREPLFTNYRRPESGSDAYYSSSHAIGRSPGGGASANLEPNFMCVTWKFPIDTTPPYPLLPDEPESEADHLDMGLAADMRVRMNRLRLPLLRFLDSAAALLPANAFIAGQRVRELVNHGSFVRAEAAARECRAERWWCGALLGYAQYKRGQHAVAALTYAQALNDMPHETWCEWTDMSMILPFAARRTYAELDCFGREEINERIWWLADPLYLEAGNERKTEHMVRRTVIALSLDREIDERQDWRKQYAPGPLIALHVRYGAPHAWDPPSGLWSRVMGMDDESIPDGWDRMDSTFHPWRRFDTKSVHLRASRDPVYPGPQYRTMPTWRAMLDPLSATDDDWDIAPPRDEDGLWDYSWWPIEFYRRAKGPFLKLPYQIGFMRRGEAAVLASQFQWDSAWMLTGPPEDAIAGIAVSTSAHNVMVNSERMNARTPKAMLSAIPSRRALLGIEAIAVGVGPASRTRFAIDPPPALSALPPGSVALSDPLLVRLGENETSIHDLSAAAARMYGTTRLTDPARLGIFWEAYGLADGDTVDVALRMVRRAEVGALGRIGVLVGLSRPSDDSLLITWREPRGGEGAVSVEAGVSVRARSIVIDVSALTEGVYSLEISMTRPGSAPALARRTFGILRPRR